MPQSQYYEQDWNNHMHSSLNHWEYNSPELFYQPSYQHSYNSCLEQPIEEKSTHDKILEYVYESERQVQKMKDSRAHQDFQIQDP